MQATEKVFQQQKAIQSFSYVLEMVTILQISSMDDSFIQNECCFGDIDQQWPN